MLYPGLTAFLVTTISTVAFSETTFLSGVNPSERPEAPRITTATLIDTSKVFKTFEGELPKTLRETLQQQGHWYTPLMVPGMNEPYDLHQWRSVNDKSKSEQYLAQQWDPIHFKPLIDKATDEQGLACHQSVLNQQVKQKSLAGVNSSEVKAWYQNLDTYQGAQENFHWRHIESPYAKKVTQFKCNTCHQGNDPREEGLVPGESGASAPFNLRKSVNPQICLMCHGHFPDQQIMNIPAPWATIRDGFQNNCLLCHANIRTNRHQVNFLKSEAIESAGRETGDSCYGCHGGRAWYRKSFPYPRHSWPGMPTEVPAWAKGRPTESDPRFTNK